MADKKKQTTETVNELSPAQIEVNEKVEKALKALDDFASYDQEKIDYIVAKCSVAALDQHDEAKKKQENRN